jgi:hypothetical protein
VVKPDKPSTRVSVVVLLLIALFALIRIASFFYPAHVAERLAQAKREEEKRKMEAAISALLRRQDSPSQSCMSYRRRSRYMIQRGVANVFYFLDARKCRREDLIKAFLMNGSRDPCQTTESYAGEHVIPSVQGPR